MVEQALGRACGHDVRAGEIVTVEPDRALSHDNSAFIIKKYKDIGAPNLWNTDKIVIVFDHTVPALTPAHQQNHEEVRTFVRERGLPHFFDAGEGVCHQVMMERGFVLPGELIIGADSHSTIYGAMNAVGIPINRTEMAGIWATGEIWLRVPQTIRIHLTGTLSFGVYAKDIFLKILSELGADGAAYRCLEFAGDGVARLSMSERMTLTNMAVEVGAKAGMMPFDSVTAEYLRNRTTRSYQPIEASSDAHYERELRIDLSVLQPQIACPHRVDNVQDLSTVVGTPVQQAYLGSCTNGRLDDLRIAAGILSGKQVAKGVRLVVYPASSEVRREAEAEGLLQTIRAAGGEIMESACGSCFGAVGATLQDGDVCISSSNRNFCGRMGSTKAFIYLSSPAVVAATCVAGAIADPREYLQ